MEIPKELRNSETGELIDHCLVCNQNVVEGYRPYFLEKVVRNLPKLEMKETLFEYALCFDCAAELREKLSVESTQKIQEYLAEHNPAGQLEGEDDEPDLAHCAMSGKPLSACGEYVFHAVGIGDQVHAMIKPHAVSDAVMDEMGDLLSAETIDELDDFKGKHFTGPPEIAKLINPKRLFSI